MSITQSVHSDVDEPLARIPIDEKAIVAGEDCHQARARLYQRPRHGRRRQRWQPQPTRLGEMCGIRTYLGSCAAESTNSGVVGDPSAAGLKAQGLDPGSDSP